jgi:hypothetical protein
MREAGVAVALRARSVSRPAHVVGIHGGSGDG